MSLFFVLALLLCVCVCVVPIIVQPTVPLIGVSDGILSNTSAKTEPELDTGAKILHLAVKILDFLDVKFYRLADPVAYSQEGLEGFLPFRDALNVSSH